MYNTFLNRYYIANLGRTPAATASISELQKVVQTGQFNLPSSSGESGGARGLAPHQARSRELQGLWMRHLSHDSSIKTQVG